MSLPTGTVTLLFSDVEGSTELLQRLGDSYVPEFERHRATMRAEIERAGGEIVDQHGEECFAAFGRAADAVSAAVAIQRQHAGLPLRVRIGLHTGEPTALGAGYVGLDVHRAARICSAAGHGGHVLLSETTRSLVTGSPASDLGEYLLEGLERPERIFALEEPGLPRITPRLRVPRAAPRRPRLPRLLRRRHEATLEQLSWATRGRLAAASYEQREALSRLARAQVWASRAAVESDRYLARIDRAALERERDSGREGTSRRAGAAAERAEHRLRLLDRVVEERAGLETAARRQGAAAEEVLEAVDRLRGALSAARDALGDGHERLRRTIRRGVFRSGDEYIVRVVDDESDIERLMRFGTAREAAAFQYYLRSERGGLNREDAWTRVHDHDARIRER